MVDTPKHLTLVDPSFEREDAEFPPLPYYPWDERPPALPLDTDECGTAIHLANGELVQAAALLKVPIVRLNRQIRAHPRLQRIQEEALQVALAKAASIPLRTLFTSTDQRALEWASTKVLASRLAIGHPLSPAPAASTTQQSLTVNPVQRSITFRWRTPDDPDPNDDG